MHLHLAARRFVRVPGDYYQQPLEYRRACLNAASVQHLCNATCQTCHQFGNVYRCISSGMLHVCDANCTSRVYRDPYSSICLISRKVCPPLPQQQHQQDAAPVVR